MGTTLDGNQPMAGHQRDCERQARQALGEVAFQAAYHRGLELPAADVLACALQQPPEKPPKKPPAPAVSDGAPLTPRELQVARLIAGGRSNKEIAAELVISQRTAEGHVERILTKLGFTSRAQVAAWVAASQPDGEGRLAAPGVQAPVISAVPRKQVVLRVFAPSLTRRAGTQTDQNEDQGGLPAEKESVMHATQSGRQP